MRARGLALLLIVLVASAMMAGCRGRDGRRAERPGPAQLAEGLPEGARIAEIVFTDLDDDGGEEALATATIPSGSALQMVALIFEPDDRGRYAQAFRRPMPGDTWEPIQAGRPSDTAPAAAVFATRAGASGNFSYLVVQPRDRYFVVTMENTGLLQGNVRFVPEGLLESRGDVDRLLRWTGSGWQPEDLWSQYLPPLPPGTVTIEYTVDAVRGPMVAGPRTVQVRVGGHLFVRRMDRGEPSRVQITGTPGAVEISRDGVMTFTRADVLELQIESPAFSGRTAVVSVQVSQ
ncbi:MAG: hypothetical protein QN178_09725 [Armatimonadota bacterium]|nr:hypothetical protein [Armatimonadota bacterium]